MELNNKDISLILDMIDRAGYIYKDEQKVINKLYKMYK